MVLLLDKNIVGTFLLINDTDRLVTGAVADVGGVGVAEAWVNCAGRLAIDAVSYFCNQRIVNLSRRGKGVGTCLPISILPAAQPESIFLVILIPPVSYSGRLIIPLCQQNIGLRFKELAVARYHLLL